ncbi:MAG TPA: TolC family protein [candidate division Zixibacteria bacterium]|nr:TolC family protein [candidate division Zixibacteria bacterium]
MFRRCCFAMVAVVCFGAGGSGRPARAQEVLSLKEALAEALAKNPEVQTLERRLEAAAARARQAPYLEDPEIAFQLGGVPFSHPTSLDRADANLIGIRQKLPFFGKLGLKEKIAQQDVKVAAQELRAKRREIIARVKTAYAELFMARKSAEILREQLEIIRTVIRATEARYQVGRAAQQDVLKALVEQSELTNQLILAEESGSAAAVALNTLMYRPPTEPIQLPPDLEVPNGAASLADLTELALVNRPELKGAEEGVERGEKLYELAQRNRKFPDFMVGWDYMRMPTEMNKERYTAMINITIPFSPWTMGKRNFEVEEALAEIRAARANRDAMRNMTLRELGESRAKVQAARRSLQLYKEGLLSQAELSFRAALAAYQTGRVEFVALLEAQRALREARMGYYKATVGLVQSLAELERVVGTDLE